MFEGDIAGIQYKSVLNLHFFFFNNFLIYFFQNIFQNLKGLAQLEYYDYGLWINGTVPYIIDNGYSIWFIYYILLYRVV